jgi:hypothetical protein
MTNILNLTPHTLNVVLADGVRAIAPSGTIARVSSSQTQTGSVDGIPLFTTTFGDVVDLPAPSPDTLLVVSALVRTAVADRKDVVSPGDLVRDDAGNVIGCKGLIAN